MLVITFFAVIGALLVFCSRYLLGKTFGSSLLGVMMAYLGFSFLLSSI